MTNSDYSPERLADRAEIQDVMYRWCRAVDRCDWHAIDTVFHPDAHDDHGIYSGDITGMVAWLTERHSTITRSMHLIGNILIEFTGPDTALVESYSVALQRYPAEGSATRNAIAGGSDTGDAPFDMLVSGRYVDTFERRDGVWRILRRTVVFDNSVLLPVPPDGPQLAAHWAVSRRDAEDPIWAIRKQLGLG